MSINFVFQTRSVVDVRNPFKMTCLSFTKHEKHVGLCVSLPHEVIQMTHKKPVGVRPPLLPNINKRISGLLLIRIDINIAVPRVDYEKLSGDRLGESSKAIRQRVQAAINTQQARFTNRESRLSNNGSSIDIICSADMCVGEIRQLCRLQACLEPGRRDEGQSLMRAAIT